MKKLINAILMLSASLNRIAALIEKQNNSIETSSPNPTKSISSVGHTHTSNPGYKNAIFNIVDQNQKNDNMIYADFSRKNKTMPTEVDRIAKDIYDALSNKGRNPRHHNRVMSDLAKRAPILFSSLKRLEKHFDNSLPKNISSDIWKEVQKGDI